MSSGVKRSATRERERVRTQDPTAAQPRGAIGQRRAVAPSPGSPARGGVWIERAEAALAAAGHKRGGARRSVLELLGAQRCALTAIEVEDALKAAERRVSRASVYRILDELERLGLVQRVDTGQAMVRYERAGGHEEHHHHLVCDGCGLVMPFSDDALEQAISSLSRRVPLAVSEHEIVLRGACRDCAA